MLAPIPNRLGHDDLVIIVSAEKVCEGNGEERKEEKRREIDLAIKFRVVTMV